MSLVLMIVFVWRGIRGFRMIRWRFWIIVVEKCRGERGKIENIIRKMRVERGRFLLQPQPIALLIEKMQEPEIELILKRIITQKNTTLATIAIDPATVNRDYRQKATEKTA